MADIIFNCTPVTPLRITSRFGPRNTGIAGASTYHQGVDMGADRSKPETTVQCVAEGKVRSNYWNNVRGWVIIVQHSGGFATLYQHLKGQSPLAVGSKVKAGQTIGIMGNSSKTLKIAVHLHFELQKNGVPIDSEPYLKNIRSVSEMEYAEFKGYMAEFMKELAQEPADGYAQDYIKAAISAGITDGTRPKSYMTRQEVLTVLARSNAFKKMNVKLP